MIVGLYAALIHIQGKCDSIKETGWGSQTLFEKSNYYSVAKSIMVVKWGFWCPKYKKTRTRM